MVSKSCGIWWLIYLASVDREGPASAMTPLASVIRDAIEAGKHCHRHAFDRASNQSRQDKKEEASKV